MLNSQETLSEKFVNKGSWILLFTILWAPLGYLIRIILAQDLTVDEVGLLYVVIGFLSLIWAYNDFGLTESLNYFLPKYIVEKDYARAKYLLVFSFCIQIGMSILLGTLLFLGADFLATHHFHSPEARSILQVMSLFFIGLNLMQISTILFSVSQNTKFQKWLDFFRTFMTLLGIGGLFFLGKGSLIAYAWAWIGGLYFAVILAGILAYTYYYRPYFQEIVGKKDTLLRKKFVQYSLWTFLSANIAVLLHQLDQQILQNMTSNYESGIYAMYLSIIGIPFIFISPIIGFLFPVVSEIHSRGEDEKIQLIHTTFSSTMVVLMIWAGGLFAIIGIALAVLLYGPDYLPSGQALFFITPFLAFNILIQINFQIMAGTGMVRDRIFIFLKTLLLNVPLMIALISAYKHGWIPFPTASSATSFSVGISWLLMWYLSYRSIAHYAGKMDWIWIGKNIAMVAFITGLSLYFHLLDYLPTFSLSGKGLLLLQIGVVFSGSIAIFLVLNLKNMKDFLKMIRQSRNKK